MINVFQSQHRILSNVHTLIHSPTKLLNWSIYKGRAIKIQTYFPPIYGFVVLLYKYSSVDLFHIVSIILIKREQMRFSLFTYLESTSLFDVDVRDLTSVSSWPFLKPFFSTSLRCYLLMFESKIYLSTTRSFTTMPHCWWFVSTIYIS